MNKVGLILAFKGVWVLLSFNTSDFVAAPLVIIQSVHLFSPGPNTVF